MFLCSFFRCKDLKTNFGPVPICIYNVTQDDTISKLIVDTGQFEPSSVEFLLLCLTNDPELHFIDIGANIGTWTLPAAKFSHRHVVSVEPLKSNYRRLQHAATVASVDKLITLVTNPISNGHKNVIFRTDPTNKGMSHIKRNWEKRHFKGLDNLLNSSTIVMNDLLEVTKDIKKAFLKIDIEGEELKALSESTSSQFFESINVVIIHIEWFHIHRLDFQGCKRLIQRLTNQGYVAYTTHPIKTQKLGKYGEDKMWDTPWLNVQFIKQSYMETYKLPGL